jgi:DNA helicase-2/ATP-dependent DNA helicase PcrA
MDKRVVFAVAGSGKTKLIIDQLDDNKTAAVITYTTSNHENIKDRIVKKFGYFPNNIRLYTYFSFIYSFCYKPFCHSRLQTKGINYKIQPSQYLKKNTREHYIDKFDRLYFSRISKLILDNGIIDEVILRIDKYFDQVYIDEVQDFASNDFNFIIALAKSKTKMLYVGDFFQHTFDTSRDGSTRKNLHSDYLVYQREFNKSGITVDTKSLLKSWRCTMTICNYISENLKIPIQSHHTHDTVIKEVVDTNEIKEIFEDNNVVKLFYQKHYSYDCFSKNWGDCKGEDRYYDVCVVLNNTTYEKFLLNKLEDLAPSTKNKLYVAISRSKNNLYFVSEKLLKKIASMQTN